MRLLTAAEHDALLAARDLVIDLQRELDDAHFRLERPMSAWFIDSITTRPPDQVIGGQEAPYMRRWWVVPRNPVQNVYLHQFLRSDDDRAHHTHPWLWNASVLLRGRYREWHGETFTDREAGAVKVRWGPAPHRIELIDGPCWTLFMTGPRVRQWGFLCPQGFVHWRDFTAEHDPGDVGKGCDQ